MTETQTARQKRCDWLVLVPTKLEMDLIAEQLTPDESMFCEICGFGPIVSAARTMQLIDQYRPAHVLLLGIAGTYHNDLPIGRATCFDLVGCFGVGVGSLDSFQTAETLGWPQWPGDSKNPAIGDRMDLARPKNFESTYHGTQKLLVTATNAAADQNDVANRLRIFPEAVAEDMEAFGVAAACHLGGTPLFVVRGISNRAGDREKSNWKIKEALYSAVNLGLKIIKADT